MSEILNEPTFPPRGNNNGRPLGAIREDRIALADCESAWASDGQQAKALSAGLEKARGCFLLASIVDNDKSKCHTLAFPVESMLALAGKASAKKFILELAWRPTAASPWVGIAGQRILRHCLGNASFGYTGQWRPTDPEAESFYHDLGHSCSPVTSDKSTIFICHAALRSDPARRALDLLTSAFGDECYDMPNGLSESEQIRVGKEWARARYETLSIRKHCSHAATRTLPARI
jgi:hypothetical protein